MEPMRVAVVDDHPLVIQGLQAVLASESDVQFVASAGSGAEAERLFPTAKPDAVLVDLRMPGEYGIDILKRLRTCLPNCRFAILSTFAEVADVTRAVEAGVDGYILKEALPDEMITALRLIGRGRPYFDPVVMRVMVTVPKRKEDVFAELTEREIEVIQLLASGLSNRDIATTLYVSENTVKKHISGILSKLQLKDRTQAALFAVSHGMDPSAIRPS